MTPPILLMLAAPTCPPGWHPIPGATPPPGIATALALVARSLAPFDAPNLTERQRESFARCIPPEGYAPDRTEVAGEPSRDGSATVRFFGFWFPSGSLCCGGVSAGVDAGGAVMNAAPYLLASERADLAFGNLRDGITGEADSCWRIAPRADAMLGRLFVFIADRNYPRTDDLSIVKVVSVPKYLRDEQEPYYQTVTRLKDGSFDRYGAHTRADELWPLGDEVTIWIHCVCCGATP